MRPRSRYDWLCIILFTVFLLCSFVGCISSDVDPRTVLLLERRIEKLETPIVHASVPTPVVDKPTISTKKIIVQDEAPATTIKTNAPALPALSVSKDTIIVQRIKSKVDVMLISDRAFRNFVKELINNGQ
jgi:hypothetical protein